MKNEKEIKESARGHLVATDRVILWKKNNNRDMGTKNKTGDSMAMRSFKVDVAGRATAEDQNLHWLSFAKEIVWPRIINDHWKKNSSMFNAPTTVQQ